MIYVDFYRQDEKLWLDDFPVPPNVGDLVRSPKGNLFTVTQRVWISNTKLHIRVEPL
jgi:hypothetical protein